MRDPNDFPTYESAESIERQADRCAAIDKIAGSTYPYRLGFLQSEYDRLNASYEKLRAEYAQLAARRKSGKSRKQTV